MQALSEPSSLPELPQLRALEVAGRGNAGTVYLRDPTRLASGLLAVDRLQLHLLQLLDGTRTMAAIRGELARSTGVLVGLGELQALVRELDAAGYLEGPGFDRLYARHQAEWESAPHRRFQALHSLGCAPGTLAAHLEALLTDHGTPSLAGGGRVAGLVAPHLDYPRGSPAYAAAYTALRHSGGPPPARVVILGTNHTGRARSPVATRKDFATPWGVLRTDHDFLRRVESRCSGSLFPSELDHLHEHSIELQLPWLEYLLGPETRIVPLLCPDSTGPSGTAPGDPEGVDLRELAAAIRFAMLAEADPTLLVASADLSHVGPWFGDEVPVDTRLLASTRSTDLAALDLLEHDGAEAFRLHVTATGNPTRMCSTGCLYVLREALGPAARAHRLAYHPAATPEAGNLVTCAAYAFLEAE